MKRALQLMEIFSIPSYERVYAHAKATCTCIKCRRQAACFRDASARLEYQISALCQGCQDEFLRSSERLH